MRKGTMQGVGSRAALVAACLAALGVASCSGGKDGDGGSMVKVEVRVPKEVATIVQLRDGRASVVYQGAALAQDLAVTVRRDEESGAGMLGIEFPAEILMAYKGAAARGAARRQGSGGVLAITISEAGTGTALVTLQGAVDLTGSVPAVSIGEEGIQYPDVDGDGAANWLELGAGTNPTLGTDAPTQQAADQVVADLGQVFEQQVTSEGSTTGGVSGGSLVASGGTGAGIGAEPNTTISSKPGSSSRSSQATFKFSTDTGTSFECEMDGAGFQACVSGVTYSGLADAKHTFKVRAVGAGGTADSTPASHTWTIDTVAPAASIGGLPATPTNATSVTATLSCSESGCSFVCSLDGGAFATCSATHVMAVGDGAHTLQVRAVDTAGNEQDPPSSLGFTTDTAAPGAPDAAKLTVTQNAPGTSDQVSGQAGAVEASAVVRVYEDGLLTSKLAETTGGTSGSFAAVDIGDNKGDASDKIYIVAVDAAGNASGPTSVTNDKTPPSTPTLALTDQTSASPTHTNSTAVNATIGNDTGVSAWFLTQGLAPTPTDAGWQTAEPTTFSLASGDGSKIVSAYVKDGAHNVSAVASASIALDTAAAGNPTLTLKDTNCPTCTATNAVGIDVAVGNDTGVDKWLVREGQATAPAESDSGWGTEPVSLTLSSGEGTKTVYAWVKDAAGNINTAAVSASIILDATAPTVGTVAASSTDSGTHVDGTFTITATVSDPGGGGSGVASCDYRTLAAGSYTAGTIVGASCTTSAATCGDAASLSINIQATDNAGNVGTGTAIGRTCDATAPTAVSPSCPVNGDQTVSCTWSASTETGSGGVMYRISYDTDAGPPYQNSSTTGGSSQNLTGLAYGVWYVCITAYDAVGNESACTELTIYVTPNATESLGHVKGDGAPDYTSACVSGPGADGLSSPQGMAHDPGNHRLFVSEAGNHRILVFNLSASDEFTGVDREADYVLGQADFTQCLANRGGSVAANTLSTPIGLVMGGTQLYVADKTNSRVLIFELSGGIANGMNATNVLGQPNFTSSASGLSQNEMAYPQGVARYGAQLYVADTNNNRVLVFDISTITNGEAAQYVLGQPNFTSNVGSSAQNGMNRPAMITLDASGPRLFVPEVLNHRVTMFSLGGGISDGMNASNVLGQAGWGSSSPATTQSGMNSPTAVRYADSKLYVSESDNHRVTRFDVGSILDGENAEAVLGQGSYTTATSGAGAGKFNLPGGLVATSGTQAGSKLYVADIQNNRAVWFDVVSISNGEDAIDGLGHPKKDGTLDFSATCANGPGVEGLQNPLSSIALDTVGHRLFLADSNNHRVLMFSLSTSNDFTGVDRKADAVLGQADMAGCVANRGGSVADNTLSGPQDVLYDSGNQWLYVADNTNHRVVVYDVAAVTDGEAAIRVLGQPDFTTNTGATNQTTMKNPVALALSGGMFYVVENGNHRVTTFNLGDGITNGEAATFVVGQPDFTTGTSGSTDAKLSSPNGVSVGGSRLYVGDTANNRVTVFAAPPIANGPAATNVLGQPDFGTTSAGTTQAKLSGPNGVFVTGSRLFVGDHGNRRIMVFDVTSIANGELAVNVIGQNSYAASGSSVSQRGLAGAAGLTVDGTNRLWLSDSNNHRIVVFNVP